MNRTGTYVLVCLMIIVLAAAAHGENAASGSQNAICKTMMIPAAPVTPDYPGPCVSNASYPAITGTWPAFTNGSLLRQDLPDPKNVPGVHHIFSLEIVTLSSSAK